MDNPSLERALDFINYTADNLFLSGKAGTGKTTFLKQLKGRTHKSFIVLAPTGVAALNAGGVTIHSQFLFPFGTYIPDAKFEDQNGFRYFNDYLLARKHPLNNVRKQVLKQIDLLVIDEISMVRADLLDAVDYRLRRVKGNSLPFGGIQLLLIGDLFQLSPVVRNSEWQILKNYYESPHFFSSLALKKSGFHAIELSKVYRQEDQEFVSFLNKLRSEGLTAKDIDFINSYQREAKDDSILKLVTHRNQADEINAKALKNIEDQLFTYSAQLKDDFPESMYPVEEEIHLKLGARVMFIKNDWDGERFFNGKLAWVSKLEDSKIWVKDEDGVEIEVPLHTWENTRYQLNPESQEMEETLLGSFSQFPLRLAWAITIHKSQGLTFNEAEIDLGRVFAPGQAYVALSRLRSLDGLYLKHAMQPSAMQVDQQALNFIKAGAGKDLEAAYQEARRNYLWRYLPEVFDWSSWQQEFLREYQKRYEKLKLQEEPFKSQFAAFKALLDLELEHSLKFRGQINRLIASEDWASLEERLQKASDYFLPKLKAMLQIISQLGAEYAALSRTKSILSWLETVLSEGVALYLKLKSLNAYWRYFRGLDEKIAFNIGKERQDLLDELKSNIDAPPPKAKRLKKGETYKLTYQMLDQGMSPAEIARDRNLALSTIYGHCSKGITAGLVDPNQVLASETIAKMTKLRARIHSENIKEIWQAFPDYTYDEWRVFMAIESLSV